MAKSPDAPDARRPSPKALLELANKEHVGKLKVFLGAAPGVGKTYAMLSAARAQKVDGVDVLVGVVETHGRSETAALLEGLDILPRHTMMYRNRTMMEFDIEAAIARRPELLLIDEFAHTNAPGSLHAKRYQDVTEALNAGIDVWTTLNIQHLESLTDVVERITGITVRETVPDKILDRADEIVVVDLPPGELIERLEEGKVYLPENARRAVDRFFKPGNLTALRELALRRTADRVDEKMIAHLRQNSIEGAWPTAERLLVCVGEDEFSEKVVRTAARMATTLKSPWVALQLQNLEPENADRSKRRRAEKSLRLAERLGADLARIPGKDLVEEILNYASRNNVTQIVVGRSRPRLIQKFFSRSLSEELTRRAQDVAITVVTPKSEEPASQTWALPKTSTLVLETLFAAGAVTVALGAGLALSRVTSLPNASLIFLLAVLGCAIRFGVSSAITASMLSFLAYNFFFIEPLYTFTVAEPYEVVSLLVFLVVAIGTAGLAGRLRQQSDMIHQRAMSTQALYDFAAKLSAAAKLDDVLWVLAHYSAQTVQGSSVILLDDGSDLTLRRAWPPDDTLSTPDWAAARWAYKHRQPAGRFTGTMPNAKFHFRPLGTSDQPRGVVGVEPAAGAEELSTATEAELQALFDQGAVAIERTLLVGQAAKAEAAAENERLRGALLSSISHDLRTPLSSIVGSVTSLRTLGDRMSKPERADLLLTIEEEAGRLSRFVSNLLDMTKIEAGALDVRRDWVDVADTVRSATSRAQKAAPKKKLDVRIKKNLPLIRGDASLLEQVIFNLLDNAEKYSPPGSPTILDGDHTGSDLVLTITDQGPGIAPEFQKRVFEKFFRVEQGDAFTPGTGLGLAICHGIITAIGGTIAIKSPVSNGQGTRITVRLPVTEQPAAEPSAEHS